MIKKTKQRERIDNPEAVNENSIIHENKYLWAGNEIKGKKILDIACGIGYGSNLLVQECSASSVTGVDNFPSAINEAKKRYQDKKLEFICADATLPLPFKDESFDIVVSFETIEHLEDCSSYIKEIKRVLKKNGLFFLSTPNKKFFSPIWRRPYNQYHKKEWGVGELKRFIDKFFPQSRIYGQIEVRSPFQRVLRATIQNRIITPFFDRIDYRREGRFYLTLKKYIFDKMYPPQEEIDEKKLSDWKKLNTVVENKDKKQYLFTLIRTQKK